MAIGAIDKIDRKLAKMYANKQTINLNNTNSV